MNRSMPATSPPPASSIPGAQEILASQPNDWRTVAAALCTAQPAPLYYQKHMTQHILPDMDLAFTEQLCNCFLIREPRRIIASYARIRPRFTLEELGFPQQLALFERECERRGEAPPVLDGALTLDDPAGVLGQLCERVGIAFSERMLHWPAGPRPSDGVWGPHWYSAVWASTGFAAPASQQSQAVSLDAEQEALCERAEACYAAMRPFALGGIGSG
jgi:hypothetical protein